MTRIDWDLVCLITATAAVILRMLDCPRASGIVSTFTLLFVSVGRYVARRPLESSREPARSARR